jgi:hypothetical protein
MDAPADPKAEARANFKAARKQIKEAARALGVLVHVSTRRPMGKKRRSLSSRRRAMTGAEKRAHDARRAYWEWQEAFKQAVDMLLRRNTAPEHLPRQAEKLADQLVKINAKRRPKDVEL